MRDLKKLIIALSGVLLLTACGSSVKLDNQNASGSSAAGANAYPSGGAGSSVNSNDPLNNPNSVLAKRSVYFEFDSYAITGENQQVVNAHANYLSQNKSRKVMIQGNTDDRGGHEYNLALGQKRAEAVRRSMTLQGVSNAQIETVSFGKEKPRAEGDNEAAWAENRRADIVYQ